MTRMGESKKKEEKGLAPLGVLTANHTGLGLGHSSERCNEPSEELLRKKTMSDEWVVKEDDEMAVGE